MACLACGSATLRPWFELSSADLPDLGDPGRARLYRCQGCELAQVLPRPAPAALLEHYQGQYLHREETRIRLSAGRRRLFRHYLDRLEQATPGRRLLDVGCGRGDFLALASARGWDGLGLELHRGAAEEGRARGLTVFEGGPERLPEGSYDVITLWNVIDQMPDPVRDFAPFPGLLKPGGLLLVRVPNLTFHLAAWRIWRRLRPGRRAPTVFHPLVFDARSLSGFLARHPLGSIRVENSALTESPIPGLPGAAAALLRPLSSAAAGLLGAFSGGRLLCAPSLMAWARGI